MAEAIGRFYNPEQGLLRLPLAGNIHTEHLGAGLYHLTRESLSYALLLLVSGEPEPVQRGRKIVDQVVQLQESSDPTSPLYGLWHYVAEETVTAWPYPDKNWADFNGMTLLLIWHLAGNRLDEALRVRLQESLRMAALCVRRRNVHLDYTNIAIKGTLVTLGAAELLGDQELLLYARDRMERLYATIFAGDSFAEYNSPTYAAVCLGVLMSFRVVVKDERARSLAREIEHRFWRHIARHFHVPTGELAGPHARAYRVTLHAGPGALGPLIEKVMQRDFGYERIPQTNDDLFGPLYATLLVPDVPEDVSALLNHPGRVEEVREVAHRFPEGSILRITTFLQPEFCLGSVNFKDGWEQRHNLMAYWPIRQTSSSEVGWLRQRYLHDARPCCSGFFASAQEKGTVLVGNFIGQFADHHVSFRVPGIQASFLGAVLEINGGSGPLRAWLGDALLSEGETVLREGETLHIETADVLITFQLLRHRGGVYGDFPAQIIHRSAGLWVELPHYRGDERELKWDDFSGAHSFYGLKLAPREKDQVAPFSPVSQSDPSVLTPPGALTTSWSGLELSLPETVLSLEEIRAFYREH
jgi:hypothetical protein